MKNAWRNFWRRAAPVIVLSTGAWPVSAADFSLPGSGRESAGDDLFSNSFIRHISIQIPEEGLEVLRRYRYQRGANASERESVPATVREGNAVYTNVAIHLKGALGSFRPIDSSKPAFTLNFDKFADGQHFHGLQKISLNNSVQDASFLHEKLSRELFTKAGVPVPRADYATVELNERYLGLYVLTEGWHKQFLRRFYRNTKGNLYDGSQVGRDVNSRMVIVSGDEPDGQPELKILTEAAAEKDAGRRVTRLRELLDLDRFVTLIALDVLLWNWDGYSMNRNNYRVFHDRSSGKLVFFPHGMDQMFWYPEGPLVTGTKGIVSRALLKTSEGRDLYVERAAQLRMNVLDVSAITNRAEELATRLRPAVRRGGLIALFQFERAVKELKKNVVERLLNVDEQLAGVKTLFKLKDGAAVTLTEWKAKSERGSPAFRQTAGESPALEINAGTSIGIGSWRSIVWLEEGRYQINARVKTQGVLGIRRDERAGAGLRVISQRKRTDGVHWDWFPFRESSNPLTRAELPPLDRNHRRLLGDNDWTELSYAFELRQPIADLEILCELRAQQGAAWFEIQSLKLVRTGPASDR